MPSILIDPSSGSTIGIEEGMGISSIATALYTNVIAIFLVSLVFFLFFVAISYINSSGSGEVGKVTAAKEYLNRFKNAFFTIIILTSILFWLIPDPFGALDSKPLSTSSSNKNTEILPTSTVTVKNPGVQSPSCASPEAFLSSQRNNTPVCAQTSCNQKCNFDALIYKNVVDESQKAGVDYRMILAIICQESSGNPLAKHKNESNGTMDCGLMQVNRKEGCESSSFDPATNVREGISIYKQKLTDVTSYSYNGVQKEAMALASYNCCGTEGSPNKPSVDCSKATGFPYDLPKWACPINPGVTKTNMCFVKNYACTILACANQY